MTRYLGHPMWSMEFSFPGSQETIDFLPLPDIQIFPIFNTYRFLTTILLFAGRRTKILTYSCWISQSEIPNSIPKLGWTLRWIPPGGDMTLAVMGIALTFFGRQLFQGIRPCAQWNEPWEPVGHDILDLNQKCWYLFRFNITFKGCFMKEILRENTENHFRACAFCMNEDIRS